MTITDANLYWVTSKEPEDWFIVAPTKEIASECHENNEGLNDGDAKAECVCKISNEIELQCRKSEYDVLKEGYWPSLELLGALGFEFIEESPPYVVKRNGRVFYEGGSCSDLILYNMRDKFGVYFVNIRNSNKYKIGFTKNIQRRLKEFRTDNPFAVDLHFFLLTEQYRQVERELHSILSNNRTVREWFEIDNMGELISAIEIISRNHEMKIINTLKYIRH